MKPYHLVFGAVVATGLAGLVAWQHEAGASRESPPRFSVDATWPKPLPNKWLVGQVAGVAVDQHDRIWIVQRQSTLTADERGSDPAPGNPVRSNCCNRAPAVLVFDREGNFLKGWGADSLKKVDYACSADDKLVAQLLKFATSHASARPVAWNTALRFAIA